jgi:membrane protein DedA with SNARE-associated domain
MQQVYALLDYLANLPPALTYLVLGAGAAIENIVPPVPADTFVLLGAFLAASGRANATWVFLATWIANVASALLVYGLARKWGRGFFEHSVGRWLLRPRQLARISRFYERWGVFAILGSRFLPAFRAVVPVFAGISRVSFPRVAIPTAIASAVWYGALVLLGLTTGRNLDAIFRIFGSASRVLLVIAIVLGALAAWWWWRSRSEQD